MSLRSSSPEKIHVQKKRSIIPHSLGLEKIGEVFADVSTKIRSVLHPHDPSQKMHAAIALADKEMGKEVRSVPGGHEAFLDRIGDVPWMKPLLHMIHEETDELRLGRSVLAVDFKGYSTLLSEGKIPPDILLQFMARFYAGVTEIAKSNDGLLFRTPMGDRVEFAFSDPSKAETAAEKVRSFMSNDFFDKEWQKRLSHFGIAEDRTFEAHIDTHPGKCVAIRLLRLSPRRILPVYSMEDAPETSAHADQLVFVKDVKTAVAAAELCPMRPAAMMAEKPDMAKEYKFVASLQCICEGKPLFMTGGTEMKQKLARAILQECSKSSSIQVFKTGEKGEIVFFSRNPAELLQFIWRISEVCRTSDIQCKAGVFGGVFHASEIYPEVQRGWPDVHGKAYAQAIRATSIERREDAAMEPERIVAGPEVIDSIDMDDGSILTSRTVSFKNMGSYTVYTVNIVEGDIRLRQAPAQDIEGLKRKLTETKTGKVQFNGNLKSACNALRREGYESMYVKCSPRTDIARKIVAQLATFFEQNGEKIIEQFKENPRSLVDFLEAHGICINIFLARSARLTPSQRVFVNKLLEFTKGTKIVRVVSDEEIRGSVSDDKPVSEEDVTAQDTYTRFVRDHRISESEEELIILFFLAGKPLNRDSVSHYSQKEADVWEKTAEKLVAKKILKFEEAEEEWSLAVDPELLEGCPMRSINMAERFHALIGRNQLLSSGLYTDPREKIPLLGRAIEHLAALREPDVFTINQTIDEIIGLCDSIRDYRLAFEYIDRKLELLERTTTNEARKAPATLLERKKILMERSVRARNLSNTETHLDSLRQLLSQEMDSALSPSEKLRLRMHFLTVLADVRGQETQEEFDKTQEEIFSFPSSGERDGVPPHIVTQFQHLASTMSRYKTPPRGENIYNLSPENYESFIEPLVIFYQTYESSPDPYVAITVTRLMSIYIYLYLLRGGNDFAKVEMWLHFAEDILNRHKKRFIETEKLTKDIGKVLYNLAISHKKMAYNRGQTSQPDVMAGILRQADTLREHAEGNNDDENLGFSLHIRTDVLAHQGRYDQAWELSKELLTINVEPARAIILYINSAEYLCNLNLERKPEGDLILARHYLGKSRRLISEVKPSLVPSSYLEEFKKWDGLIAQKLDTALLMPIDFQLGNLA